MLSRSDGTMAPNLARALTAAARTAAFSRMILPCSVSAHENEQTGRCSVCSVDGRHLSHHAA
jgi:hypothetical protein